MAFVLANLGEKRRDPDADEERIAVESVEDVALSVNLASVDLVEQRHHNERVEDDREVLSRRRVQRNLASAVDVKQYVSCANIQPRTELQIRFFIFIACHLLGL